jgi:hypothetical protein
MLLDFDFMMFAQVIEFSLRFGPAIVQPVLQLTPTRWRKQILNINSGCGARPSDNAALERTTSAAT